MDPSADDPPMRLQRRTLLGLAVGVLSGCTGGSGSQPTPTDAPSPTGTATPTAASSHVRVRSHPDLGEILVGPAGRTLYMFERDTKGAGTSACYDTCAENWPPHTAEDGPRKGEGVTAPLSTFERENGAPQVAAAGWPLYYFAGDGAPGDAEGHGAGDVWWTLAPDGTPVTPTPTTTGGGNGYY